MNVLPVEKETRIINALVEGVSIRATSRLVGVEHKTVLRVLLRTGKHCADILDSEIERIYAEKIQVDEIWTFVFKKQARITSRENDASLGDQYVFIAMDAQSKLVISYLVGKRNVDSAYLMMSDLRARVVGRVQITTDGFSPYVPAVRDTFGPDVDYAQLVKLYGQSPQETKSREWHSPMQVVGTVPVTVEGRPKLWAISTSYIERQNLTLRMQMRRFTRLTNAFSKKLENLKAACALHFAWYNFCRVHSTLRVTPAMAAGVTSHVWGIGDLLA